MAWAVSWCWLAGDMTADEVFTAALERADASERASFVAAACAGDAELLRRVSSLLSAHESAGSFLEGVPFGAATSGPSARDASPPLSVGASIGPYVLTGVLGEGGMGTVYEAEQRTPVRRRVALKVVRADVGAATRARFRAERAAAGRMDHPGVARVLEAGTTSDGREWFAMELFRGRAISAWCDERRVGVRGRVELMVRVCRAVQHAHQKGVVHRDLKPGNVLVGEQDGRAAVKVIDFGVSKAVGETTGEATGHTQHGQLLGTLRYMAPEQAQADGGDVDTRADVYGLGAVLYELLTGSAPLGEDGEEGGGLLAALERLRDEEPSRPSARVAGASDVEALALRRATVPRRLVSQLRGDLDWIVMRCLSKDREGRYASADALASDLERHLQGRAVAAGPPSLRYRVGKVLRRHRRAVALTTVGLAALVAGGVGAGWVLRERATRRAAVEGEVGRALDEADREQASGRWDDALAAARRAEALLAGSDGLEALRERAVRRREDLEFVRDVDRIRHRAASRLEFSALGPALAAAFRSLGVDVDALSPDDAAAQLRRRTVPQVAAGALDLWAVARAESDSAAPSKRWRRYVEVAMRADPDPLRSRMRDAILRRDGAALVAMGARDTIAQLPPDAANLVVVLLRTWGFRRESLEACRAAQSARPGDFFLNLELGTRLIDERALDDAARFLTAAASLRPDSVAAHQNLSALWAERGRFDEAADHIRRAIELAPDDVDLVLNLALVERRAKRHDDALVTARGALDRDRTHARSWAVLAGVQFDRGDLPACIEAATEAVRLRPEDSDSRLLLAKAHGRSGALDEAIAAYREVVRTDPKLPKAKYLLASNLWKRGLRDEAIAMDREAVLVEPTFAPAHYQLGLHLAAVGDRAGAVAAYRSAVASDGAYAEAHCNLGLLLQQTGRFDEALAALQRGHELGRAREGWTYPSASWVADAAFARDAARLFGRLGRRSPEGARAALLDLVVRSRVSTSGRNDALWEGAAAALAVAQESVPELAGGWRRLALEWLVLDLSSWPQPSPGRDAARAAAMARALELWESSRRFASVRGAAVDALPEPERAPWRALWAEVARRREAAAAASR
ncbi:MAG: protein kinase [Planctomycetes bacterium]|nr:protein kinase [Planctomycetota bacterium]